MRAGGGAKRWARRAAVVAAAWAAVGVAGDGVLAQDAKPDVDAARKKSTDALRQRAQQWLDLRKTIVFECPNCNGRGFWRGRDCSYCVRGGKVSADKAKQAYYEFGSPAWREDAAAIRKATDFLDSLPKDPALALLRSYKIESVELVGSQFGIVRVSETRDKPSLAPEKHYWVLALDRKTNKPTWYVWHDTVDPPFGQEPASAAPPGATPPAPGEKAPPTPGEKPSPASPGPPAGAKSKPVDLPAEERETLDKTLAVAGVRHGVGGLSLELEGDVLVVTLRATGMKSQGELDEAIARDVVPVTRVALTAREKPTTVRLVFEARYRDKIGDVIYLPYRIFTMTRELFGKIKFENLSREEVLDLYDREDVSHRLSAVVPWWKD